MNLACSAPSCGLLFAGSPLADPLSASIELPGGARPVRLPLAAQRGLPSSNRRLAALRPDPSGIPSCGSIEPTARTPEQVPRDFAQTAPTPPSAAETPADILSASSASSTPISQV